MKSTTPSPRHVGVLVLGDIGRSPRMQYHALSLADSGSFVHLIGFSGATPLQSILNHPLIRLHPLPAHWWSWVPRTAPPHFPPMTTTLLFLVAAAVKIVAQSLALLTLLFLQLPTLRLLLVQTPPALPTLPILLVARLLIRTRSLAARLAHTLTFGWLFARAPFDWRIPCRFVVDWHNFGFTILQVGHRWGDRHPVIRLARWVETTSGRLVGDAHFCVSVAMQEVLAKSYRVTAHVVHDRPPPMFCGQSVVEQHELFRRLGRTEPILKPVEWTAFDGSGKGDENFSIRTIRTSLTDSHSSQSALKSESARRPESVCVFIPMPPPPPRPTVPCHTGCLASTPATASGPPNTKQPTSTPHFSSLRRRSKPSAKSNSRSGTPKKSGDQAVSSSASSPSSSTGIPLLLSTTGNRGDLDFSFSLRADRPAVIVSSTSWTEDEDFGILLQALRLMDERFAANLPGLLLTSGNSTLTPPSANLSADKLPSPRTSPRSSSTSSSTSTSNSTIHSNHNHPNSKSRTPRKSGSTNSPPVSPRSSTTPSSTSTPKKSALTSGPNSDSNSNSNASVSLSAALSSTSSSTLSSSTTLASSTVSAVASVAPRIIVLITGRGPLRAYYEEQIAARPMRFIAIRTLWLAAEDYPKLLGSADVGVCLHFSSSGVDLPMKVVDMFGAGLPVCAVKYPALSELVKHEKNGYEFTSSEQLATQLESLLSGFPHSTPTLDTFRANLRHFQSHRWPHEWREKAQPVFETLY